MKKLLKRECNKYFPQLFVYGRHNVESVKGCVFCTPIKITNNLFYSHLKLFINVSYFDYPFTHTLPTGNKVRSRFQRNHLTTHISIKMNSHNPEQL